MLLWLLHARERRILRCGLFSSIHHSVLILLKFCSILVFAVEISALLRRIYEFCSSTTVNLLPEELVSLWLSSV